MSLRALLFAVVLALVAGAGAGAVATLRGRSPQRATLSGPSPVLVSPVNRPRLTSAWGRRGLSFHTGVDLRAAHGERLRAVGGGVVERARTSGPGGLTVVIKLDSGWRAGYAHLSRIDVVEGERIGAGDVVGLAGSTGRSTGPHLHFTLREPRRGRFVDPWPLLSRR